jgi:hypothetical protein
MKVLMRRYVCDECGATAWSRLPLSAVCAPCSECLGRSVDLRFVAMEILDSDKLDGWKPGSKGARDDRR